MKIENFEPITRSFTKMMTGEIYYNRKFKLIEKFENLKIPFKWNWIYYKCECCNHIKQDTIDHTIHTLEIYKLEEEKNGDEPNYRIYLGYTKDKKVMSIPITRRIELQKYLI